MAYVPGYAFDIFISYPRESDEPDPWSTSWVTEFHRHLKNAINERIPDKNGVRIYFDSQNFEAGHHSQGLLDAAGQAALFLAVVSPKYVAPGKFTLDELAAFCDNGQPENRIISIEVLPVRSEDRPRALRGPKRIDFYVENESGAPIKITPKFRGGDEFYERLQSVAEQIKRRLDEMRAVARKSGEALVAAGYRSAAPNLTDSIAFSGKTVLLAQVSNDLYDEVEGVRAYLEQFGVNVLPEGEYPHDDQKFAETFEAHLAQADLFVQLLSPYRSNKLTGLPGSEGLSCAQFQLNTVKAATRAVPILQWRDPAAQVDKLTHWDKELLEGADVRAMGFEEFKREIRKKLEGISQPAKIRENSSDLYIYIAADDPDLGEALELKAVALKAGTAEVMEQKNRRKNFNDGIEMADAVVFLYGNAPRGFVDEWLKQYRKRKPELKHAPKVEAVFFAPPPKTDVNNKLRMGWKGLQEVGSQDGFFPQEIEKIVAELQGGDAG
jgi:TIR domain